MGEGKYLVVMSADFGMCPAVNEGIVEAFTEGLLTDANVMVPCPSFREAAALARQHKIPVGLHATFTCEWPRYPWGPVTDAPSLVNSEGYFKSSVKEAWATADEDEALAELRGQYELATSEGIRLTHIGEHMGMDEAGKFARVMSRVARENDLPHYDPLGAWKSYVDTPMPCYRLESRIYLDSKFHELAPAKAALRSRLEELTPGYHIWATHAAADRPSLDELCGGEPRRVHWARTYRVIGGALLLDPEVKEWIDELGIEPVSLTDCPVDRQPD